MVKYVPSTHRKFIIKQFTIEKWQVIKKIRPKDRFKRQRKRSEVLRQQEDTISCLFRKKGEIIDSGPSANIITRRPREPLSQRSSNRSS